MSIDVSPEKGRVPKVPKHREVGGRVIRFCRWGLPALMCLAFFVGLLGLGLGENESPLAHAKAAPVDQVDDSTGDAGVGGDKTSVGDATARTHDITAPTIKTPSGDKSSAAPDDEKDKPAVGARLIKKKDIFVGDRVELVVTVIHESNISVNLPAGLELHDDVSVISRNAANVETLDDGKKKQVFSIFLAPFKAGKLELKPITIVYTHPRGSGAGGDDDSDIDKTPLVAEVTTEPINLEVKSVLANEPSPDLKSEAPPVQVKEENRTLKIALMVIGAVIAGILIGFLLFLLWKKRKRVPKPPPPPRPAHEIALEKLRALEVSSLRDEERFTDFYFGVSEAVREYLGNRYGFDSLEMTTTELLATMKKAKPVDLSFTELEDFSHECDLVKFAKYKPTREEADIILKNAYSIVEKSKLIPSEPAESGVVPDENLPAIDEGTRMDGAPSLHGQHGGDEVQHEDDENESVKKEVKNKGDDVADSLEGAPVMPGGSEGGESDGDQSDIDGGGSPDRKGADSEDADSEDADSEDADSKDADSEDADSEDADSKDADSEDADSKDADSKKTDRKDADSKKTDRKDDGGGS